MGRDAQVVCLLTASGGRLDGTATTDLSQATGGRAQDPGGTQLHSASLQLVCADAM